MKLQEPKFRPFPVTTISPQGWLRQQLRIQADGLSGHLCDFWPDIGDSAWIGGEAEGWERMPYWLDGAPISVGLKARKVSGWVEENGSAGDTPVSPVVTDEPLEDVVLIPYGCTKFTYCRVSNVQVRSMR